MKQLILLFAATMMIAACSSPKYAYHFDHYDYNSGKKKATSSVATSQEAVSPLAIEPQSLVADAHSTPVVFNKATPVELTTEQKAAAKEIASMSKAELKQLKKDIKTELKKQIKTSKKDVKKGDSINASKAMDNDLKMALIFGVVAILLSAFTGFNIIFGILGLISLVVAVVFFIQWLARQ